MPSTPPKIDDGLAPRLAALSRVMSPSLTPEGIVPLRRMAAAARPSLGDVSRDGSIDVTEAEVRGPVGAPAVPVLLLRPHGVSGALPCLLYLHGGGMVSGDSWSGIDDVLDHVVALGVAVLSVDYRLAPEHPHPAPADDCYAALVGVVARAHEFGIDPAKIVLVGRSAGGALAAGLAQATRDRGGPALLGQLLLCPMLDDRELTASSTMLEGEVAWDRISNRTGWSALLGAACGGPDVSPYTAPARAEDLSRLPPAYVDVGSVDVLRDAAVDYAQRIWAQGGDAELHVWPGGFHGFDLFAPSAVLSRTARAAQRAWLLRILAT